MRLLTTVLAAGWLSVLGGLAGAIPPDRSIRMALDSDRFEKGPQGSWVASSLDPEVVVARYYDTAEVLLQAGKPGTTLVVLTNRVLLQAMFWLVRVGQEAPEPVRPDPVMLKKACGCGKEGRFLLSCQVKEAGCLGKLREFLKASDYTVDEVRLQYTVEGLQALLADLQSRLANAGFKEVRVSFLGANLRVSGAVADEEAWLKLMATLYQGMVGRLIIEDQIERRKLDGG